MLGRMKCFIKDENGATAIEYGLIVALVALVILIFITSIGQNTNATFSRVNDSL